MAQVKHSEMLVATDRYWNSEGSSTKDFFELPIYDITEHRWLVTDKAEQRIRLLCSPHWETVIKAWKVNGVL